MLRQDLFGFAVVILWIATLLRKKTPSDPSSMALFCSVS